jgi:hypothetical protein
MKDRLLSGGIAGMVGAVVQNIYSYVIRGLNLAEHTYSDFATTVLTSRVYSDPVGLVVGFIAYLAVGVILGILFAYLIASTGSDYHYIKGLLYGLVMWFILTGFGTIFGLATFIGIPPVSALLILAGGLLYGVVTAYMLKALDAKNN